MTTYYELSDDDMNDLQRTIIQMTCGAMEKVLGEDVRLMEGRLMQAVAGEAVKQHLDKQLQRMEEGLARAVGASQLFELRQAIGELCQKVESLRAPHMTLEASDLWLELTATRKALEDSRRAVAALRCEKKD